MTERNIDRPAWQDHAACIGHPLDLFFPTRGEDASHAKAICARCPVRDTCLEHALANGEHHGIFGGMSERERRRLRVQRRREEGVGSRGPIAGQKPINHGSLYGYYAHRKRGEEACPDCKAARAAHEMERKERRRAEAGAVVVDLATGRVVA